MKNIREKRIRPKRTQYVEPLLPRCPDCGGVVCSSVSRQKWGLSPGFLAARYSYVYLSCYTCKKTAGPHLTMEEAARSFFGYNVPVTTCAQSSVLLRPDDLETPSNIEKE